jgi:4-amino-4-deoxy-L-arabinose transferase-like glycosyltransferase
MKIVARRKTLLLSILIMLLLFFTNFVIQIGVNPSYKNMSTDSGTFAYCGEVIRNGGLIYRDCWDNKPPAVYYLNAVAIWLGGANPFAIWLFQAIWLTVAILAFFLILMQVWEHTGLAALSAFSLLLLVLYPDIFQGGNFTETYAILPVVLSLGTLWAFLRSGRKRWLVILGLLTALGFLLKPTYISIGVTSGIVIAYLEFRRRSSKTLLTYVAILGASFLVPLLIVGLYFVFKHDFYELWFATFLHNFTYLSESFSLRSLYGTARMFLIQQPMVGLTVLVVISLGVFLYQFRRLIFSLKTPPPNEVERFSPGRLDPENARVWFLTAVFMAIILDIAFLASSGKNFGHYLQVLLPGMVVGMVYLLFFLRESIQQDRLSRNLQAAVLVAILIVSIGGGMEIFSKEFPSLGELKAFFSTPNLTQYQPTELEQYIIDHSSPYDSVLVWAGHPGMNFVTQRRSPTKYIFLLHLFAPTPFGPNGFKEFLSELASDPPQLIVVQPASSMGLPYFGASSDSLCPNCDPLTLQGMQAFKLYVDTNYELKFSIWDWEVYQRTQ